MKLRSVVGLASVALVLSACSNGPSRNGLAAIVDGQTISTQSISDQVNQARTDIQALPAADVQTVPSIQMLGAMAVHRIVLNKVLDKALAGQGITISDTDVTAFEQSIFAQYGKESVVAQLMTNNGVPASEIHNFFRTVLIENVLEKKLDPTGDQTSQTKALVQYLGQVSDKLGIEISPRFGKWDNATLQPTGSDDVLSTLNDAAQFAQAQAQQTQ